jgi:hypothetical protein
LNFGINSFGDMRKNTLADEVLFHKGIYHEGQFLKDKSRRVLEQHFRSNSNEIITKVNFYEYMTSPSFKMNYNLRFLCSNVHASYLVNINSKYLCLLTEHALVLLKIERLISSFYEPSFFFRSCIYLDKNVCPYRSQYIFSCFIIYCALFFLSTFFFSYWCCSLFILYSFVLKAVRQQYCLMCFQHIFFVVLFTISVLHGAVEMKSVKAQPIVRLMNAVHGEYRCQW